MLSVINYNLWYISLNSYSVSQIFRKDVKIQLLLPSQDKFVTVRHEGSLLHPWVMAA